MVAAVALVEVRFEPAGKVVFVQPGTTLLAASEAAGVELAFGCRRGMCGTDAVHVSAAAGGLEQASETECGTLERMGLDDSYRLSCSARVSSGVIEVELGRF